MGRVLVLAPILAVVLSRLAHLNVVWIEEAYGMAAAANILRGKDLYSQIWFDKPPLYAAYYLFSGAQPGWPLRLCGGLLVLLIAAAIWLLARELWGEREATLAGALMCFFLTFWIHSAVMPAAPDLLMMAPHIFAILFAVKRWPWLAGSMAGIALLCNSKGMFVLAAVLLWSWQQRVPVVASFAAVQALALLVVSPPDYWREVWLWGFRYSADSFVVNPVVEGLKRSLAWAGFHGALVIGAGLYFCRERNWRLLGWLGISLIALVAGLRFFPRYYFVLLPVMTLCAARGLTVRGLQVRTVVLLLCLIPLIRFGPRYVQLATYGTAGWSDAALMEDSRRAGALLRRIADPEATLLVWGYRPDVFVFSGLPAGTPFLDSQPLTGVLADRHLTTSRVTLPDIAATNRRILEEYTPTFIVDGLGSLNPSIAIDTYPDLRVWLSRYELLSRTDTTSIYRLRP